MGTLGHKSVFISYSRKDGAELAQRLQSDLRKEGFEAWLDTQRIGGGAVWTKEIEAALDEAEYVIALLTNGSYLSEICRAEQLRALRKGKCVIPLKAQRGAEVPLHLEGENYRDFTPGDQYTRAFDLLLSDLRGRKGSRLRPEFRSTYVTAPPLPINFVERPEAVAALRNFLIADEGGSCIALTALEGMGGIGKTVLAQAICHDEVVQEAFPDGVIWVTIGKESTFDALTRMREVGKALGDDLSRYDNDLGATNQYRSTIRSKAALIVVDDVWDVRDLDPLRAESSPRSRLLFTTRDKSIAAALGAHEHVADLLTQEQSRDVLARWSRTRVEDLPPLADDVIQECGRLPLALSMAGAMLSGKPLTAWKRVHELLRKADLAMIAVSFPGYRYPNLLAALQVSVNELADTTRERYLALCVLLEDMSILPVMQQCLWGVDELEAAETAERLLNLSLAQRDGFEGAIRLHDLQLDYVRAQHPDREALELIHEAMRYSTTVIAEDPKQFAPQIAGRLLALKGNPTVGRFLDWLCAFVPVPWLRPLFPALKTPAGEFIRTLAGHTLEVTGVAVTPDSRLAVSSSADRTVRVWDLEKGRVTRILAGHTDKVTAVAVTPDGERAVTASFDRTLKVWELETGRELRTLAGHSGEVMAVAIAPDGCWAISASWDRTLKVWDLETGRELRTLAGHKLDVTAVAVTSDQKYIVSASGDGMLKVWKSETGHELRTLAGHENSVPAVAVTPDRKYIISASGSKMKVWDFETGRELRTLAGHWPSLTSVVAVTPDGKYIISASQDKTLKVWDFETGRELRTLAGHESSVTSVAVTPDGKYIISASEDETLKVWDVRSYVEARPRIGHTRRVNGVAVTPNGKCLISASEDKTMKVWDLETGRELLTLAGHESGVNSVAVTPDGQQVVSASEDRTVKVWELATGRPLRTLGGHKSGVDQVAVTPDGRQVVSVSRWESVKVWDLADGRERRTIKTHKKNEAIGVTPCGRHVVSIFMDGTAKVLETTDERKVGVLKSDKFKIHLVRPAPDGERAIAASLGSLKLWELRSGRELRTFGGHRGSIKTVAVTPDSQRAVSASDDGTLKLWDLGTGEALATFTCDSPAGCCTFADSSGTIIIAGDETGSVHILRFEEPRRGTQRHTWNVGAK